MSPTFDTNHTPGPWTCAFDSYGVMRVWNTAGHDVASAEGDGSLPREQRLANAVLIAAAPDLLAALKGLSDMYAHAWDIVDGGLFMNESSVKRFEKVHAAAEKAIAKAKGTPR